MYRNCIVSNYTTAHVQLTRMFEFFVYHEIKLRRKVFYRDITPLTFPKFCIMHVFSTDASTCTCTIHLHACLLFYLFPIDMPNVAACIL